MTMTRKKRPLYAERRGLRRLEGLWERGERLLGLGSALNPMHHLGALALFFLAVLAITGLYLIVFYRPGMDRAYETTLLLSQSRLGSLVRSAHRYAADGLLIVILLHALKLFLMDRFWGSRALAWVSGWLLVPLIVLIGAMGYWLVWDGRAQWLTEWAFGWLGAPTALAFLGENAPGRTFGLFVIVLFLHVFLALLVGLGLWVHVSRLSRPRLRVPRAVALGFGAALLGMALLRTADLAPPADFSRLVPNVPVDTLYLAFLPLARLGPPLWAGLALGFLTLLVLPKLLPGRHPGPAVVIDEEKCTGCALCAEACPYGAIRMKRSRDGQVWAGIDEKLCVGCGLCLGTCFQVGMALRGLPDPLDDLHRALSRRAEAERPVVVCTCQRHAALTFGMRRLGVEEQKEGEREDEGVLVWALPCVGMLNPLWLKGVRGWVRAVLVWSCPEDDCGAREGPSQCEARLRRWQNPLGVPVRFVSAYPGDRRALRRALAEIPSAAEGKGSASRFAGGRGRAVLASLLVGALVLGVGAAAERPATPYPDDVGALRLLIVHPGVRKASPPSDSEGSWDEKLPPGVSAEQLLGGEKRPLAVRVWLDGERFQERVYRAGGLRHEGLIRAVETWVLPTGSYALRVEMNPDGARWREVFSGEVRLEPGRVLTLRYDPGDDRFLER